MSSPRRSLTSTMRPSRATRPAAAGAHSKARLNVSSVTVSGRAATVYCLSDQTVAQSVLHEVVAGGDTELGLDPAAMGLDSADAQEEHLADLLVGVAEGDEPQDLDLARAELPALGVRVRQLCAEPGRHVV